MSAPDAFLLLDYWNFCPPAHVSAAVQARIWRERPTFMPKREATAADFQQVQMVLGDMFRGVGKLPTELRDAIKWAEDMKGKMGNA